MGKYALDRWLIDSNIGRIISQSKQNYVVGLTSGEEVSVRKKYGAPPYYVGDVVCLNQQQDRLLLVDVVERKTIISKASNQTAKDDHKKPSDQVLATNVDQLFVLLALDRHYSLSKVERLLLVFQQEAVELTIVLTKKDLYPSFQKELEELRKLYPKVCFIAISLYDETSLSFLTSRLKKGKIGLMIGASGAGKTSLLNKLLGSELLKTNRVRKDQKGRHTTTTSTLNYCSHFDYYLIDSPGFKGIDSHHEVDARALFEDIVELGRQCQFSDCRHASEPGCAVKEAVARGEISFKKLERYHYQEGKISRFTSLPSYPNQRK